jgi:hypothetical protein
MKKKENQEFALKLLLMEALAVSAGRETKKRLLEIIKLLEWK